MARLTPPHPHSPHPIPPDPTSFPRTRESSEKQSTPFTPLRKAKGDASAASRGMPEIHRNTPNRNNHPLSLHPTRRGGSRTAPTTQTTNPLHHHNTTYPTTTVPPGEPHVIPADAGIQRKTKHAANHPLSR